MPININFGKTVTSGLISRTLQTAKQSGFDKRLTAFLLMSALLIPIIFLGSKQEVSAKNALRVTQQIAPVSQPPQPFVLSSSDSVSRTTVSMVASFNTFLVNGYASATDFFTTPQLPEGFAAAKPASPASAFISSVSNSLSSFFTLSASKTEESINAAPAAVFGQPAGTVWFDFDGDGKADIGRRRPSNNEWQVKKSTDGSLITTTISASGQIVPADYDGDGKTDMAVFTASTGTWTIKRSSDGQTTTVSGFGQTSDVPVSGNYTGDSKADLAVFRPSNSTWYFREVGNTTVSSYQFGASGDIAVPGNYDGDIYSIMDYAVFRPSTGYWYVQANSAGFMSFQWGSGTDIPVPADYDNDGKTDYAVYRPSSGTWYAYKSSGTGQYITQVWGNYGDQPVPADYDNDGKADFAVWRPTTGIWHILKSSNSAYEYQTLGAKGDTAVSSAYLKQIGAEVFSYDFMKARLAPKNATGGTNLYSQNFSWGTSLVNLPGRAGLDAGLGISYNSLVWTKYVDASNNNQTTMVFDADSSNISPGFRFGFPVIEPAYYNGSTYAYLMVMPSGERVEFRQTASIDTYETADSSYSQLKINGAGSPLDPIENITITVFYMGGTQMSYSWKAGAYRCSKIVDRNGNRIDITHSDQGLLTKVKDTLEREINVNYDTQLYPTSITQTWKDNNGLGSNVTHTWATFSYEQIYINPSFNSGFVIYGPSDSAPVKALKSIVYPNGNSTYFYYNDYGQVWKIRNIAADSLSHELNLVRTDLETFSTAQQDCPRFTKTYNKIENFNGGNEFLAAENLAPASASFTPPGGSQQTGTLIEIKRPDGAGNADKLRTKIYSASSGWAEGLPVLTEDWADEGSGLVKKRWTWTKWAQDDENLSYILNPRVEETKVGDTTNTKRTTIEYHMNGQTTVSDYGLVKEIIVYDTDQSTILKKEVPEYLGGNDYLSRRLIGFVSKRILYGRDENNTLTYASVEEYGYDEEGFTYETNQNISNVVQHDNTNYSSSFVTGRGNLTSIKRLDVTGQTSAVTTKIRYDIAGSVVARLNPLNHKVRIEYADVFNDTTTSRNTYAYPTKVYDPDDNYSSVKYRFDIGANVWAKSPAPAGNTSGKETAREFDSVGRLSKETIVNNGAYTRYEYPTNGIQSKVYSTLIDTNDNGADSADEVLSESWTDGAGRVLQSRKPMSWNSQGNTATWSGQFTEYDILGRIKKQSIPAEVDSNWSLAGDDAVRNYWLWTYQKYDWKSRVTRIINSDGTDSPTLNDSDRLFSYDGCGCAGGQVMTTEGERVPIPGTTNYGRRKQKIYEDILGRAYKTENFDWDGTTVYSTIVQKFNGRDQVYKTTQYAGTTSSQTYQETTASYDGHGRLKQSHRPEQRDSNNNLTYTNYNYNADDSISSVVDARGAETEYTYSNLGLVTLIEYQPPSGVADTPDVYFYYDAVGNLTQMNDGPGVVDYSYNELSQLISETRKFDDSLPDAPLINNNQAFKLEYGYHLAGSLKFYKDPYDEQINLSYDKTGRLSSVTGTSFDDVTDYALNPQYRAWGTLKHLEYGNGLQMNATFNNRLQAATFEIKHPTDTSKKVFSKEYQYYQDGALKYIKENFQDQTIKRLDRSYSYDHMGRIKEAKSGTEASGQTQTNLLNLPYRQSYDYDAFGQMTERESTLWTEEDWNFYNSFTNNRNSGWTYDAAGNALSADSINYEFDAANRMIKTSRTQGFEMTIGKAGGGQDVKRSQRRWNSQTSSWNAWETHYFIGSSVLGKTVSETTTTGKKKRTFVIANGTTIARQVVADNNDESVSWEYSDASGQSIRMSGADGTSANVDSGSAELDTLGNNVGTHGSLTDPRNSDAEYSPFNRAPISAEIICNRGGIVGPCSLVEMLSRDGTLASIGTALPFQFTPQNHRTGHNYQDRFYLAQYENSLSSMIDSGFLEEIAGNNSGGEEGCPGGVCDPEGLQVVWNPSTFIYTSSSGNGRMGSDDDWLKKIKDFIDNIKNKNRVNFGGDPNHPCSGVTPLELNYDKAIHPGGETTSEHILRKHIGTGNHNLAKKTAVASFYITDAHNLSKQGTLDFVKLVINPITFLIGNITTKYDQHNNVQGYEIVAILPVIPWHPNDPRKIDPWSRQEYIGYERISAGVFMATGVNSLILSKDCKTVVTSFPGEPIQYP